MVKYGKVDDALADADAGITNAIRAMIVTIIGSSFFIEVLHSII
jgi:hypothetical protein